MKNLIIVLLVALSSSNIYAGTEINNYSDLARKVEVFPFEAGGITFKATQNDVENFHPQGVELERITKVHRGLIADITSSSKTSISRVLEMLDSEIDEVTYQITTDPEPRVFISNIYENGKRVEGKISIRVLIPGKYDYRGVELSESRFIGLYSNLVSDIRKKLMSTDKYRAVVMLQESSEMLGRAGRAPAFVGEIEVADGPRESEQLLLASEQEKSEESSQR